MTSTFAQPGVGPQASLHKSCHRSNLRTIKSRDIGLKSRCCICDIFLTCSPFGHDFFHFSLLHLLQSKSGFVGPPSNICHFMTASGLDLSWSYLFILNICQYSVPNISLLFVLNIFQHFPIASIDRQQHHVCYAIR